jgi:hypothetical protein
VAQSRSSGAAQESMEMLEDIGAYNQAKTNTQSGEEVIPSRVVYALLEDL